MLRNNFGAHAMHPLRIFHMHGGHDVAANVVAVMGEEFEQSLCSSYEAWGASFVIYTFDA